MEQSNKTTNYREFQRNSLPVLDIRIEYGMEGYGIYKAILEFFENSNFVLCENDFKAIAYDLDVDTEKVRSIIQDFYLFETDDDGLIRPLK